MTALEFFMILNRAASPVLINIGIEVRAMHSSAERSNPSYALNLRRRDLEIDLIVWASGHADLATNLSGSATFKHFENLNDLNKLEAAVSEVFVLVAALISK